jgi:hypothetical protein
VPEVLRFVKGFGRLNVERWNAVREGDAWRLIPPALQSCDIRSDPQRWTDREFRLGAEALCVGKMELKQWAREFVSDEARDTVVLGHAEARVVFRVRGRAAEKAGAPRVLLPVRRAGCAGPA